jgi:transaldolase
MTNPIHELHRLGQSVWYDNIERRLLADGTLAEMVANGTIRGITSNPSIFKQAIASSSDYDEALVPLAKKGLGKEAIYEALAVADIRAACDLFLPLYQESHGGDGYVSLEVSPYLAHDTQGTLADARRLWALVERPNLMVKIPATKAGLPAITAAIAEGININVTLIFALERYQQVMEAYLEGLEHRLEAGKRLEHVASVASFFVSRIDTHVDSHLEALASRNPAVAGRAEALLGKAAIASARLAYDLHLRVFQGERFLGLKNKGARGQRPLWASTSTKNPAYPDTRYVDELVGPYTVNTIPPKTLAAFEAHGVVARTLDKDLQGAKEVMEQLAALGISMVEVTDELETQGVKAFADSYTELLDSIEARRLEATY